MFLFAADVVSEESILKWFKDAQTSKGKMHFVEQMKKFIEWLQNAEEGKNCEAEKSLNEEINLGLSTIFRERVWRGRLIHQYRVHVSAARCNKKKTLQQQNNKQQQNQHQNKQGILKYNSITILNNRNSIRFTITITARIKENNEPSKNWTKYTSKQNCEACCSFCKQTNLSQRFFHFWPTYFIHNLIIQIFHFITHQISFCFSFVFSGFVFVNWISNCNVMSCIHEYKAYTHTQDNWYKHSIIILFVDFYSRKNWSSKHTVGPEAVE